MIKAHRLNTLWWKLSSWKNNTLILLWCETCNLWYKYNKQPHTRSVHYWLSRLTVHHNLFFSPWQTTHKTWNSQDLTSYNKISIFENGGGLILWTCSLLTVIRVEWLCYNLYFCMFENTKETCGFSPLGWNTSTITTELH